MVRIEPSSFLLLILLEINNKSKVTTNKNTREDIENEGIQKREE